MLEFVVREAVGAVGLWPQAAKVAATRVASTR